VAALSDCSASCLGDTQWSCGGQQRLTAFGPNLLGLTPIYQGYFTDEDQYEWGLDGEVVWSGDGNTPDECAWHCFYADGTYDLFGLEDGDYCLCGHSVRQDSHQVSETECATSCTGDST
jgi:hypothetical protein